MIKRKHLRKMPRSELERFARWLNLWFSNDWSNKHLANLVYWRITRGASNRH